MFDLDPKSRFQFEGEPQFDDHVETEFIIDKHNLITELSKIEHHEPNCCIEPLHGATVPLRCDKPKSSIKEKLQENLKGIIIKLTKISIADKTIVESEMKHLLESLEILEWLSNKDIEEINKIIKGE